MQSFVDSRSLKSFAYSASSQLAKVIVRFYNHSAKMLSLCSPGKAFFFAHWLPIEILIKCRVIKSRYLHQLIKGGDVAISRDNNCLPCFIYVCTHLSVRWQVNHMSRPALTLWRSHWMRKTMKGVTERQLSSISIYIFLLFLNTTIS